MNARKLAALAALALSGCSLLFNPADVEEPPKREELVTWVEAWLDAYLAAQATCQAAPVSFMESVDLGSRAAYRDRMLEYWGNGKRVFDRAAAAECLALVQSPASCDALLLARYPDPSHPCQLAMRGTAGVGEACASTLECNPSLYCDGSNGVCPGNCAPRSGLGSACGSSFAGFANCRRDLSCNGTSCVSRHLSAGAGCASSQGFCGVGLYCDSTTTQCAPLVAENGDCSGGQQCGAGLYCDGATCEAKLAASATCTVGSFQCATGYRCGPASTCVPYASLGETCGDLADGGEFQDCGDSRCYGTTCVAVALKGQPSNLGCAPYGFSVGAPAPGAVCADVCP